MARVTNITSSTVFGGNTRSRSSVTTIVRHHSATSAGDHFSFWNHWNGTLGWRTGGYQEIILRDGEVQIAYEPTQITNGVGGHNSYTYHICFVGNGSFTDAQEVSWKDRAENAMDMFNLSVSDIRGHREMPGASTSCPGINMGKVRRHLRNGEVIGGGSSRNPDILRDGDSGSNVKQLQEDLMELGYDLPEYGADGMFGSETESALKAFQREADIAVDGLAGPETFNAIKESKKEGTPSQPKGLFRVRKSWGNPGSQIGAFENKDNAVRMAEENDGYHAYNSEGDKVSETEDRSTPEGTSDQSGIIRLTDPMTRGDRVKSIQQNLNKIGASVGSADGVFGPKTEEGVKDFQRYARITVDGIYGDETEGAIDESLDRIRQIENGMLMRRDDTGSHVNALQEELKLRGFFSGSTGSTYGPRTEGAVEYLQRDTNSSVDGVFGPESFDGMLNRLEPNSDDSGSSSSSSSTNNAPSPTLRRGSSGSEVRNLQETLDNHSPRFNPRGTDGSYGPLTHDAVRRYQMYYGLDVDGIYGPQTASKLEETM